MDATSWLEPHPPPQLSSFVSEQNTAVSRHTSDASALQCLFSATAAGQTGHCSMFYKSGLSLLRCTTRHGQRAEAVGNQWGPQRTFPFKTFTGHELRHQTQPSNTEEVVVLVLTFLPKMFLRCVKLTQKCQAKNLSLHMNAGGVWSEARPIRCPVSRAANNIQGQITQRWTNKSHGCWSECHDSNRISGEGAEWGSMTSPHLQLTSPKSIKLRQTNTQPFDTKHWMAPWPADTKSCCL